MESVLPDITAEDSASKEFSGLTIGLPSSYEVSKQGSSLGLDLPLSYDQPTAANLPGCIGLFSPTTASMTGDLAESTHPNHGSRMAMPETRVMNDQLHQIPWGSVGTKNSYDKVHASWNSSSTFPCARPLIPKGSGTVTGLDLLRFVPYGNDEHDHRSKRDSKADKWPSGYLLPFLETPAKDDRRDGNPLGVASPNCLSALAYTPWNNNTMYSYPHLPLPEDHGTIIGLHVPGTAIHEDRKQCRIADRSLEAEQGPSESCVPLGYLPACRNDRKHKRRRFTNGEKVVISYKRKVGVCRDCRQAKRKASL